MDLRTLTIGGAIFATIIGTGSACNITVEPVETPAPPTTAPPTTAPEVPDPDLVSFGGDKGFAVVYTVVAADAVVLGENQVRAGTYLTAGELDGAADGSCEYLQTRIVPLDEPIENETQVVARTDDADLPDAPQAPPLPEVDIDGQVVLVAGDRVSADGCQDFVLQDEDEMAGH